jgi:myo-inositol-1(or 4)-monophosphatase
MYEFNSQSAITPHLLVSVENYALRAASMVRAMLKNGYDVQTKKDENDLVTSIDFAVNNFLREQLYERKPLFGWVSEESKDNAMEEFTWVVDPIDGTSNMVKHNREFAISIGLVKNGVPILGVVIHPTIGKHGTMISGAIGLGLYVNKQEVIPQYRLSNQRVILSHDIVMSRSVKTVLPQIPMGSIAWRLANIAIGNGDITLGWYPKGNLWDIAAGHALILVSGGLVTDKNNNAINYTNANNTANGLVATGNKENHDLACRLQNTKGNI